MTKFDLDDFIEFGKKAFGVELTFKKSDNPDTYEKLFGNRMYKEYDYSLDEVMDASTIIEADRSEEDG